MTLENLIALFEDIDSTKLERPPGRPDLRAFNLLDKLVPGDQDLVSAAGHDNVWLDVDPEDLAKVATEEDVRELIRCGVFYDTDTASLSLFV